MAQATDVREIQKDSSSLSLSCRTGEIDVSSIKVDIKKTAYAPVPYGVFECARGMGFAEGSENISLNCDKVLDNWLADDDLSNNEMILKSLCLSALGQGATDLIVNFGLSY
ncbi:MAG: hypothetical protein ACLP29_00710 [Dissulfurispiraceae bacterium]